MNRKVLSVVFSALICSTLGHEYQRANEITQAAKNHNDHVERKQAPKSHSSNVSPALNSVSSENAQAPKSISSQFKKGPTQYLSSYRSAQNQCSFTCLIFDLPAELAHDDYLTLVNIDELKVIGYVNTTAQVAIVFDFTSVLILNGNTGALIWIDLETSTGFHIAAGSNSDDVWLNANLKLTQYLRKLGSLSHIKNVKNVQKFDLKKTSQTILTEIITVVKSLSIKIVERAEIHKQAVISILITLTRTLSEAKDPVSLIFGTLDSEEIIIYNRLADSVTLLSGLLVVDKKIDGGLKVLLTKDFSLSSILSTVSGIGMLFYLMNQTESTIDLTEVLGDVIKSPETLLETAVAIDGGKYDSVSGITAMIYNIQLYVAKKISLEALIDILIQVTAGNTEKLTKKVWSDTITYAIDVVKAQIKTFNNEKAWSSITQFLNDLKNDKLVIGGIDVSAIINILIETSGTVHLGVVVRILAPLKAVVSLVTVISVLYLRILWFIISGQGIIFILKLLPKIKISIDFSSTKSVIQQILASVHLSDILYYVTRLDVVGLITHLPVIGVIFEALGEALKAVVETSVFSLAVVLKESGSIIGTLKEWIWHGLGLGGKQPPSGHGGIAGLSIIGGGGSVSWTSKWTSTVTWTQTSSGSIVSSSSVVTESPKVTRWSWGWGSGSGGGGSSGSGSSSSGGRASIGGGSGVVHPGRFSGGSNGNSGGSSGGWSFSWG